MTKDNDIPESINETEETKFCPIIMGDMWVICKRGEVWLKPNFAEDKERDCPAHFTGLICRSWVTVDVGDCAFGYCELIHKGQP